MLWGHILKKTTNVLLNKKLYFLLQIYWIKHIIWFFKILQALQLVANVAKLFSEMRLSLFNSIEWYLICSLKTVPQPCSTGFNLWCVPNIRLFASLPLISNVEWPWLHSNIQELQMLSSGSGTLYGQVACVGMICRSKVGKIPKQFTLQEYGNDNDNSNNHWQW